jgi:hypothetical protein
MRKSFQLMFVVCCFLPGAPASAMPPLGRESDGLIQSVDANNRTLTIKLEGESRLQTFEWNKDTRFLRDWKSTTSAALKAGVTVRIRYHSPIFGKPFVTRVIFLELQSNRKLQ